MMAAGRGEFFRIFKEGLERKPAQRAPGSPQPGRGRGEPCTGGGQSRPRKGQPGGKRGWKRPPKAAPSSVSGNDHSCSEPSTEKNKTDLPLKKTPPSKENLIERLPSEILFKILSYLDASSLACVSQVSKLFHWLSSDDVIWNKIYMSEFGSQTWKPKVDVAAAVEVKDRSAGHWKKMYFRTVAGQEMNRWRREMRHVSPYTGLPRQTEWVLRNLNVSWNLTVRDCWGREFTVKQSRVHFFKSSVIVWWSGGRFPRYHLISSIQLYGVRKETLRPGWRSLILKLDMKKQPVWFIGKDKLVKLLHYQPGFIVGVWRGQDGVAFVMVSLHFHRLVERSLLGSPVCPYSEPVDPPLTDHSDPEFGLHGYTLHVVLHSTATEIMSRHFRQLSCHTVQMQRGLMELRVINRTDLTQHRLLSGNITLPWKSEALEGSVEKCCIITLTLLDEFQKPFWCLSSPISITPAKRRLSLDYSGEHFKMDFNNSDGKVRMMLVWLKEQKQFFLISLTLYVSLFKVNKHFGTAY